MGQRQIVQAGRITRKAPRARDRPASWVMTEVPRTTRMVVAWKMSSLPSLEMNRYMGRSKTRPPAMRDTIQVIACTP